MEVRKELDIKDELYNSDKYYIEKKEVGNICEVVKLDTNEYALIDGEGNKKIDFDRFFDIYVIDNDRILITKDDKNYEIYDENFNLINSFCLDDESKIVKFNIAYDMSEFGDSKFILISKRGYKKYTVMNKDGKVIVDNFDYIPTIKYNYVICHDIDNNIDKYIDFNGNERFSIKNINIISKKDKTVKLSNIYIIDENGIVYKKYVFGKEKYGLLNDDLNVIAKCKYDDISYLGDGYYSVCLNDNYGVIDIDGNIIFDIKYNDTSYDIENNLIIVKDGNKNEFYDINTKKLIFENNGFDYYDNCICNNQKKEFLDLENKKIYNYGSNKIKEVLSNGIYLYYNDNNTKVGLYDYRNDIYITDAIYNFDAFSSDCDKYILLEKDEKFGVLDKEGNILIPFEFKATDINYITGDLFEIKDKIANINDVKTDYKVSLYDDKNDLLISRSFDTKEKQDKACTYFEEELNKSEQITNNYVKTYEDIINKYKKRKVSDFKRKFRDSEVEDKLDKEKNVLKKENYSYEN